MFDRQTRKFCSAVVDALPELSEDVMQGWIGNPKGLQEVLRDGLCPPEIQAVDTMIVRRVRVDRIQSSEDALLATSSPKWYVNRKVIATMPVGVGEWVDVYTFKPSPEFYGRGFLNDGFITSEAVEQQFELRGLKPDPRAVAAMNEADHSFAANRFNGTQWRDSDGNFCCLSFEGRGSKRTLRLHRNNEGWYEFAWLSGVRK